MQANNAQRRAGQTVSLNLFFTLVSYTAIFLPSAPGISTIIMLDLRPAQASISTRPVSVINADS